MKKQKRIRSKKDFVSQFKECFEKMKQQKPNADKGKVLVISYRKGEFLKVKL